MFSCPSRASACDGTCHDCPKRKKRFLRYVFLDIDGVLNSRKHLEAAPNPPYVDRLNPTDFEIGFHQIIPELVLRLNSLVAENVVFVLSSMWRRWFKTDVMQEMLRQHGFLGTLADATPVLSERPRGQEIASWLESETGVELSRGQLAWPAFVILDDNSDMDRLMCKLVQTDYDTGLQDDHIRRAREMLGLSPLDLTSLPVPA